MVSHRRLVLICIVIACCLVVAGAVVLPIAAHISRAMSGGHDRTLINPIITENALPGTDEWASIGNYDINNLSAYPGATSVNAGNSIGIYVKSSGATLSARLYRLGYYHNHGARLVTTFSSIATPAQPACTRVSSTGLVRCPWSQTFSITTASN